MENKSESESVKLDRVLHYCGLKEDQAAYVPQSDEEEKELKKLVRYFLNKYNKKTISELVTISCNDTVAPIPGYLQYFVDYYLETSPYPSRLLATQTALAYGAFCCSHYYCTNKDNYTSGYFLILAPSASGKDHTFIVLDKVLSATNQIDLLIENGYTSHTALFDSLSEKPRQLCIMDEFGDQYISIKSQKNPHKQLMLSALKRYSEGGNRSVSSDQYAHGNNKDKVIEKNNRRLSRVSLTLIAISTPDSFLEGAGERSLLDGTYNRFVPAQIFEKPAYKENFSRATIKNVPLPLIEWSGIVSPRMNGQDGNKIRFNQSREISVIPFDSHAHDLYRASQADFCTEVKKWTEGNFGLLFERCHKRVGNIALEVQLSIDPYSKQVSEGAVRWAWNYVSGQMNEFVNFLHGKLYQTKFLQQADQVSCLLKRLDVKSVPYTHLLKRASKAYGIDTNVLAKVLDHLEDLGKLQVQENERADGKKGKKGRTILLL